MLLHFFVLFAFAAAQPRNSEFDDSTKVTKCPPEMSKVRCAWRKLTGLHFERRRRLNSELPQSPEEAIARGYKELPAAMSIYHDNRSGKQERKFVNEDGREVVYDGETGRLYYDPRYLPTYNYYTPLAPSDVKNVKSAWQFVRNGVGHVVADVIPYKILGNVRTDSRLGRAGDARNLGDADSGKISARYIRLQEYLKNKRQNQEALPAANQQ